MLNCSRHQWSGFKKNKEEQEEWINVQEDGCFIPLLPVDEEPWETYMGTVKSNKSTEEGKKSTTNCDTFYMGKYVN